LIRDTIEANNKKIEELLREAEELSKILAAILLKAK
jgi:hypothetical protein